MLANLKTEGGHAVSYAATAMLGGVAQFEREIMLERRREGIAKAKVEGLATAPVAHAQMMDKKPMGSKMMMAPTMEQCQGGYKRTYISSMKSKRKFKRACRTTMSRN